MVGMSILSFFSEGLTLEVNQIISRQLSLHSYDIDDLKSIPFGTLVLLVHSTNMKEVAKGTNSALGKPSSINLNFAFFKAAVTSYQTSTSIDVYTKGTSGVLAYNKIDYKTLWWFLPKDSNLK